MIGLRRIAGSRSDALILHVKALGWGKLFVWRVSPQLLSYEYVEILREGFSQTIGKRLD